MCFTSILFAPPFLATKIQKHLNLEVSSFLLPFWHFLLLPVEFFLEFHSAGLPPLPQIDSFGRKEVKKVKWLENLKRRGVGEENWKFFSIHWKYLIRFRRRPCWGQIFFCLHPRFSWELLLPFVRRSVYQRRLFGFLIAVSLIFSHLQLQFLSPPTSFAFFVWKFLV